jgi:CheY-like chemotaxis protein
VKPLDLNAVLGALGRMLRRTIREDIAIQTDFASGLGSVTGDSALIEQAVVNLAVNAQDAMPEGGRLTIRTTSSLIDEDLAQTLDGAAPGAHALLSVSDTGVGMDESTRARVFEPFFTTKGLGKGTGLGLSMVYGVVKQHGGFIEVESAPGRGTEFRLFFPTTPAAAARAGATSGDELPGGDEVILIVEDQEAVLLLTSRMLSGQGYTVLTALTGADALSQVAAYEGTINLLITDVVMPGMNGRELHEALQAMRPGLEVIYMSGYPADVISSRAELPPGTHFLQKPVPLAALASKVRAVLDG